MLPSNTLSLINEAIGPSPNLIWVSISWTAGFAAGFTLMGRLNDIFGRRWFFIESSILAIVGNIIGASAQSISMLIVSNLSALDLLTHYYPESNMRTKGTNTIDGLAAAGQLSFPVFIGELVSNRMRGPVNAFVLSTSVPYCGVHIARRSKF